MSHASFACASLLVCFVFVSEAVAQSADEGAPNYAAERWVQRNAVQDRPRPPNLTGTSLAFSVAGEVYTFGGDHLRLPGEVEGWEDDIAVGVGVFRAMGQYGHYGAGVGVDDEEDLALRAHMAMKW